MKPILLALPAAAMILAGCDASTPNQRTKSGALIGAAVGGALGANSTSDNKLERGIIGAAIGGTVGGLIGNELDKQANDLRRGIGSRQPNRGTAERCASGMRHQLLRRWHRCFAWARC